MLAAFGGAYRWTYLPAAIALSGAAIVVRPALGASGMRVLDAALAGCLAWGLVQVIPLPAAFRSWLSPNAARVDALLRFDGGADTARTLSIDASSTWDGVAIAALAVAMFVVAREVCARHGTRGLVRVIAWTGLAISVAAVFFATSSPGYVYGLWFPDERARPYGPFVNRNHMGTWLVMALPLVAGYLFSRFDDRGRRSLAAAIDARMIWLLGSAAAMLVAVIASLSRSTAVGVVAGGAVVTVAAARHGGRALIGLIAAVAAVVAIAVTNPRTADLSRRFEGSGTAAAWTRDRIWRETIPMVTDFPVTGTGIGTYATGMLVYQRSDRALFFNQAHNHYLQIAAEGGLVLVALLLTAAITYGRTLARLLRRDRTPMFWIRVGAAAGMGAALVQSVWETGLRLPANALLFAALAAIAVHGLPPHRSRTV
jgi:O-antigen ligase